MFLLDTDILTLLLRDNPKVIQRVHSLDAAEIATTIISRIEILRGRFASVLKAANKEEWLRAQDWLANDERSLAKLKIVPIDEQSADEFERLKTTKKVRKMGLADLLIACLALSRGATLVTRNVKDYRLVPGLKIENWAD